MTQTTELNCRCGAVHIEVGGDPILSVECCCDSCRNAARLFEQLPDARPVLTAHGTTRYEMYRKDRVRFVAGAGQFREHRLTPQSSTRRVVAACCNTPLFTEFKDGHWLSLYGGLWPAGTLPPLEMRTMAGDMPDPSMLPADVPNARSQSLGFFGKLLWAWMAMGFRVPKIAVAGPLEL